MKRSLLLFLVLVTTYAAALHAADTQVGVVQIISTFQEYNDLLPWQKKAPGQRTGYGVRIDKTHIITTEAMVRNTTLVELRLTRSGRKIPAKVIETAPAANLAILEVPSEASLSELAVYKIAPSFPTDKPTQIVQFDDTREVQTGDAKHLKVSLGFLPNGGGQALIHTIQTDLNLNGRGAAVLHDGKLVGILASYATSSRTAEVIDSKGISDFVESVKQNEFHGFATAGFGWASLIDPEKRAYLGVENNDVGVVVLSIRPGSGASKSLKPQDVIIEWDGYTVDNLGFYQDPDHGRLLMPYLIKGRHKPGDVLTVKVIRNRKPKTVTVTLSNIAELDALIPENLVGERSEYLVEGGILFRDLSGHYMRQFGQDWSTRINARLVHSYYTQSGIEKDPGERIVVIGRVLPDPINRGYSMFTNHIVTHVNGKPISNMNDLFAIRDKDTFITRIRLHSVGVDLVLKKDQLAEANQRIANNFRISDLEYRIPDSEK